MNWKDITRIFPKCPGKSIYQYRSDVFPVWWFFNGYGGSGHGVEINGFWNCVFTFAVVDNPENLVDHVLKDGLMIYRGTKLTNKKFACLYEGEFLVYKKVL